MCFFVKKSLYELKQSPRQWYKRFDSFVISKGYQRSSYDSCVYYNKTDSGCFLYLLLYVDDMLIACKEKEAIRSLKCMLRSEFEMKDLGPARKILGMEIHRSGSEGLLFLSQTSYVEKLLKRFNMMDAKPVSTPIARHFKLSSNLAPKTDDEINLIRHIPYSSATGSLMDAMVCTRPDLAYSASLVSRFMSNPGNYHWSVVKWIFRYLKGSKCIGLIYGKTAEHSNGLSGFVDADFAGDLDKRRSLTGYLFTLYGNAVSWKANLQTIVALSTTESEYVALIEAVKEAIWLKGLINELEGKAIPTIIWCDSQSAICLSKNQVFHERTKHIDIRLHYIGDIIAQNVVEVKKVGTEDNPADMLTKVVAGTKFSHCLNLVNVGICCCK